MLLATRLASSSVSDLEFHAMKRLRTNGGRNYDAEGLGPPQPLMHLKTPLGVGCRRLETPDCASQPESKSKK